MPTKKMDVPPADEGIEPAAPVQPVAPVNQPMPPSATYVPLPSFQPADQKPGMVQAIAIMTLVNGIFNILYGLSLTMGVVLGTLFIGIICAPVTILPTVLGIFEIVFAVKLLANPPQPVKPSPTIAILEIVTILTGNLISMIVGILALVFYNDANVKAYFARINNQG